ncbi:MAG TPA: glycosyltransferase family 1 protein [Tissierellia bacterium]|nr:glycosyltransferase family 1 protein [Tissierellia bacterium]
MYNYNENIYYMPNGVRTQDYAMSYYVPKDLEKINKPIVFFMGTITGWVDLELIDYISKERPNYSFVYVGNIAEVKEKDIPRRDNIYYLGKKKYTELVNYLKQARVAIIPFKENKLTASVTPLKFFEYISAGVPVVTTMFPDLIGIKNVCIANNYSEFLDAIDKYIEMDEDEYRNLQQELFKTSIQFEWSNMLDKLIAYLENNENKEEFKKDFINNTIDYYEIFSDNTII